MYSPKKFLQLVKAYHYYVQRLIEGNSGQILQNNDGFNSFSIVGNRIVKNNSIKVIGVVSHYPQTVSVPLSTVLRKCLPKNCTVTIVSHYQHKKVDLASKKMKKIKDALQESVDGVELKPKRFSFNTQKMFEDSSKAIRIYDSWNLIFEKCSKGQVICDSETVFLLRFPYGTQQIDIDRQLVRYKEDVRRMAYDVDYIDQDVDTIFKELSPMYSYNLCNPVKKYTALIDENIGVLEQCHNGNYYGDKLLLGMNMLRAEPLFCDLTKTDGGLLSLLIYAVSGGGKSFYVRGISYSFLDISIPVIIWDKDGEYSYLTKSCGGVNINLGSSDGVSFNTLFADSRFPEGMTRAMTRTISLLGTICKPTGVLSETDVTAINIAMNELFKEHGVSKSDVSTWKLTKNLNLKSLYSKVKELSLQAGKYKEVFSQLETEMYPYLTEEGMFSHFFSNQVDMDDIISNIAHSGNRTVINIDMQSKTKENESFCKLDKIKSLTMTYITESLTEYFKSIHKIYAVIIDEFQRHASNPEMVSLVKEATTHGRKDNMIPVIITNGLGYFNQKDNPDMVDIFKNINIHIVGAIKEDSAEDDLKELHLEGCKTLLNKMYLASKPDSKDKSLANTFLIKIADENYLIKMMLPKYLAESKIFKTRD